MISRRIVPRLATLTLAALLFASCADTVVETRSADGKVNVNGSFETIPTTTLPVAGSAGELLAEMYDEMGQLSFQIAGEGDETATLQRADAIWVVARPDVEASRPELVQGLDTTVEMATTAVTRIRPADADKAFQILGILVDRFDNNR